MAATFFRGQSTNIGVAANWTNGLPDSTHTPAIFDGSKTQTSALVGLDRTGDLFQLVTYKSYKGQIGEPGNPLIWEADYTAMRTATILGSGDVHLENPLGDLAEYVIRPHHRHASIYIKAKFARFAAISGNVLIDAHSTFAGLTYIMGTGTRVLLPAAPGAEAGPTFLYMDGGYFENSRNTVAGNNFTISGGELTQKGQFVAGVYLNLNGGIVRYQPDAGYLGAAVCFSGIKGLLDLSEIGESMTWGFVLIGPEMDIDGDVQGSLTPTIDLRKRWP